MSKSAAQRAREYRARKRGGEAREPEPCGSPAAAKRHRRNGEEPCGECADAERKYNREAARKRRDA